MSDRQAAVERAKAYPFWIPAHSFLQVGSRTLELALDEFDPGERIAVLAFGSNAAPEVLARKLCKGDSDDSVPAVRATLSDFDVVYSAHISPYGSIPAALQASHGTRVSIFVIYLTDEQLRSMSRTEPNYDLVFLHDVSCQLDSGAPIDRVASYMSHHGCLRLDGAEVALASVDARQRRFPSMSEPEVLERVRGMLSPDEDLDGFVAGNVEDAGLSRRRTQVLREGAAPFAWARWKSLTI